MKKTAYILYSCWFDDFIFHSIFTSKEKLDAYIAKFIPEFDEGGWSFEKVQVDPTSNEGL